jgi:polysaccharide pyruvyl transferase WcaK-like protein
MKQKEVDDDAIKEVLAADSKLDEYGEQSDEKENEILQSHWLQMQQKDEDVEEGGGGRKRRRNKEHERTKKRKQQGEEA